MLDENQTNTNPEPVSTPTPEPVVTPEEPVVEAAPEAPAPVETPVVTEAAPEVSVTPEVAGTPSDFVAPSVSSVSKVEPSGEGLKAKLLKTKGGLIGAIAGGIALVALVVFGVYQSITSSPKALFKQIVNTVFEPFEKALEMTNDNFFNYNPEEDSILYDGEIKVTTNFEEFEFLSDETINYKIGMDAKNNKAEIGLGLSESGKELIAATLNMKDEKFYIELKDLLDEVIVIDKDELMEMADLDAEELEEVFDNLDNIQNEDLQYILKEVKEIIKDSLGEAEYTKTSETTEINGEDVKVKRISLALTEDNMTAIMEYFFDEMINHDKLIERIAKVTTLDASDIKDALEDAKDSMDFDGMDEDTEIVLYTKGLFNKVVKAAIVYDGDEIAYYSDYKDIVRVVALEEDDEVFEFEMTEKEFFVKTLSWESGKLEKIVSGTINELKDDEVDIEFKTVEMDGIKISGSIKSKMESKKLTSSAEVKVSGDYEATVSYSTEVNKKSKKEYDYSMDIKIDLPEEDINVEVKTSGDVTVGADVATLSTGDTIKFSELSEDDAKLEEIATKLLEKLEDSKIYEAIQELNYQEDDPYNDDYDYDYDYDYDFVYDEYDYMVTDSSDCSDIYTDGTWYYNFAGEGMTYAGTGTFEDGYCVYYY